MRAGALLRTGALILAATAATAEPGPQDDAERAAYVQRLGEERARLERLLGRLEDLPAGGTAPAEFATRARERLDLIDAALAALEGDGAPPADPSGAVVDRPGASPLEQALASVLVEGEDGHPVRVMKRGQPLAPADLQRLLAAVRPCWQVDDATAGPVTLAFRLDREARVYWEVEDAPSPDEEADGSADRDRAADAGPSLAAARRAVLACRGEGFGLPPAPEGTWRLVRLAFDPATGTIR